MIVQRQVNRVSDVILQAIRPASFSVHYGKIMKSSEDLCRAQYSFLYNSVRPYQPTMLPVLPCLPMLPPSYVRICTSHPSNSTGDMARLRTTVPRITYLLGIQDQVRSTQSVTQSSSQPPPRSPGRCSAAAQEHCKGGEG